MHRHLLIWGILLAIQVGFSLADCNICSAESKAACVSRNQYQNCTADSIPTGPIYTCPNNTNCTASAERCTSNADIVACNECNKCDLNSPYPYACTSPSSYAYCDGVTCSYYDRDIVIGDFCNSTASTGRYPYPNDSSCLRAQSIPEIPGSVLQQNLILVPSP
ncbi:uncharacterized protein LOC108108287 [Drosophila eugracilis]|uniref:uncharacterized protein LOC108108287 n=1 Tax=Drosophila eugracilis TaxID=29029 RepID=UPI001BD950F4|nr:uncharacterized protein LOC108108287 [Drosophila eugracilis]